MSIEKLKLLEIEFPDRITNNVLSTISTMHDMHFENANKIAESVSGIEVLERENIYEPVLTKLNYILDHYHIDLPESKYDDSLDISAVSEKLDTLITSAKEIEKVEEDLRQLIEENEGVIEILENLHNNNNFDFDSLLDCKYLTVRFGKMPSVCVNKLKYYENLFLYYVLSVKNNDSYLVYVTVNAKSLEVDNVFNSLYFEEIRLPDFIHGTAKDASNRLKDEIRIAKEYLPTLDTRIQNVFKDDLSFISTCYKTCTILNQTFIYDKYIFTLGDTNGMYCFILKKDKEKIVETLQAIDPSVHVSVQPASSDYRLTPPTKLKENFFSKPFKMFVEMYGLPSYTDFDPTTFVAISYTLLFGIMYGDVGQGALLIIVGYLAYKLKGMKLGLIGTRIGIASIIFGVVFGSVFGSEEIIKPFFAPMSSSNTMTLLMSAVAIGAVLSLISMIINVYVNYKKGNKAEMLFSQNGIAGIIFYFSVLLMVVKMLLLKQLPFVSSPVYIVVFIVVPLILIFLKEAFERKFEGKTMFKDGFGGYVVQAFFELFDVCLTFLSNTMSFLRVGGFVLSHAGMMLVVYTLAEMVGGGSIGVGYILVLILGNLFVMCLEGLIVGIQVLRLEFYEMFSRYYEGKGIPFESVNN